MLGPIVAEAAIRHALDREIGDQSFYGMQLVVRQHQFEPNRFMVFGGLSILEYGAQVLATPRGDATVSEENANILHL